MLAYHFSSRHLLQLYPTRVLQVFMIRLKLQLPCIEADTGDSVTYSAY